MLNACDTKGKKSGTLSARQLIMTGLGFCSQLHLHHSIEEEHIFPVLARRMPEFRAKVTLLEQHREIHAGMDKLQAYLEECRCGEADLQRDEVQRLMDGFGKVLWTHLDDEVHALRAENMRKYWTVEEVRKIPF
ncbi:hypothetical protein ASPZODRAFT_127921 [Penicilliopsis zonata CBS 506.65]|uniref:Hemerythrin-like domain-containing protein n=1 Tax=Penicilliopsis zonata CBS 506.65 TaxID=1073090 RepID=A0A1L9SXB1_9EURO|nr:hypothetical protein ASPZODRAFT_127921 [Penicilliopsis zonata CBS 506.65]OJJ51786.1 hypothetical protein ASPZODRAFT_127921 [Penicilliopsis zonata CBS 506.65]